MKKNCKSQIKQRLQLKKQAKEKIIKYIKWKGYDNSFNIQIDEKHSHNKKKTKVELDSSNHV